MAISFVLLSAPRPLEETRQVPLTYGILELEHRQRRLI